MKIAIVFEGSLTNRKGLVNAVLSRIKHLQDIADYQIDVYSFQQYEGWLTRKLKRISSLPDRVDCLKIDDINIRALWYKYSLTDYILRQRLNYKDIVTKIRWNHFAELFKQYDLISAHSYRSGKFALYLNKLYNIPYYVTWHGSDIHTIPQTNRFIKKETISIIESATCNFFVSNALLIASHSLTKNAQKRVLYNGASEQFFKKGDSEKSLLRQKYYVQEGQKVVAYVGNLFDIKNVLLLPEIFEQIQNSSTKDIVFWIVGDGELRKPLQYALSKHNFNNCHLWGNVRTEEMPNIMNCIDILILPSKNEGLPLVTVEALKCGANVVGSNVGGIPEVIGIENSFNLDDAFINNISQRVVEMLSSQISQSLDDRLSWIATAENENQIYKSYFQ